MKAIATNPGRREARRQREQLRHLGNGAVESRVEAGELWRTRQPPEHDADRREVVRLVQRRERHVTVELCQ